MEVPTEWSRVQATNAGRKGGFKEEVTLGCSLKTENLEEQGVEQDQQGRKGKGTINTKAHEGKRVSVSLKGRPMCLRTGYAGVGQKGKRRCRSLGGRRERVCVCASVCVYMCVSVCVCVMQEESVCGGGAAGRVCLCVCTRACTPCRLSVLVSTACQTCSCLHLQKSQAPGSLPIPPPLLTLHHSYGHCPPCRVPHWTPCFPGSLTACCTPAVVESGMLPST